MGIPPAALSHHLALALYLGSQFNHTRYLDEHDAY
jgi:hypothetical protein